MSMVGVVVAPTRYLSAGRRGISTIWPIVVYAAASFMAAAAFGTVVGLVGGTVPELTSAGRLMIVSVGAGLLALRDARVLRLPLPMVKRQVPHGWRFQSPTRAAAKYGAVLAMGFLTPVYGSGLYVVVGASFLLGNALFGALIYGAYGISRAAPMLALGIGREDPWEAACRLGVATLPRCK